MWGLPPNAPTMGDIVLSIVLFLAIIALTFVIGRTVDSIQKKKK